MVQPMGPLSQVFNVAGQIGCHDSRYTQPEPEHRILLDPLRLSLPTQPPPKITIAQAQQAMSDLAL